jgi:hypothetical protein
VETLATAATCRSSLSSGIDLGCDSKAMRSHTVESSNFSRTSDVQAAHN